MNNQASPVVYVTQIPKVSIGLPVYNGEPFIRETLESLLMQTFTDFELIISDNASTDETETICRKYSEKDDRIRYVRQATNLGPYPNFEFVLHEAVGEYFMWAAADDLLKPTFIERLVSILDQDIMLCCVMSDVENIFDQPEKEPFISYLDDIRNEHVSESWKECRKRFFRNPTSNIFFCFYGLFRAEKIKRAELNYHGLVKYASASEVPFLAQMSLFGRICSISEPLKIYRRHASSIYHEEQSRISTFDRLNGFVNVAYVLLRIVAASPLSSIEKVGLYSTVLSTSSKWFIILLIKHFIRQFLRLGK